VRDLQTSEVLLQNRYDGLTRIMLRKVFICFAVLIVLLNIILIAHISQAGEGIVEWNTQNVRIFPLSEQGNGAIRTNYVVKHIGSIWDAMKFSDSILREAFPDHSNYPSPTSVIITNDYYVVNYPSMISAYSAEEKTNTLNSVVFNASGQHGVNIILEEGLMPTGEPWRSLFQIIYQKRSAADE